EMRGGDGMVSVSPKMLAKIVYETQTERPWWMNALNITKPSGALWVLIGLLGQLLFSGRMLVQWIVSEKQRKSVIPVAFWWLALGGASMLLVYFIWRRDIIGILGQGTGWLIYIRNLYFIFREHRESKSADAAD
ncbi:MAG: lipid-A-disaccharide synthase N-terminal domain-containing protein, partial [Victivallales bacterium]|nr:lipid-A-disaccharide synthase N-terminal domain-containing protein [Victivallales bacterium]